MPLRGRISLLSVVYVWNTKQYKLTLRRRVIGYCAARQIDRGVMSALAALGVTRREARGQLGLNHIEENEMCVILLISINIFRYTKLGDDYG